MSEVQDSARIIQQQTRSALERMAKRLRELPLTQPLATELDLLAADIEKPCIVAIVGRMKAGKSTFINALLDVDLAVTGPTETTATVNYLSFGDFDLNRPRIRLHYRNGDVRETTKEYADSLQGHDLDTLRRAESISHIEYNLRASELQNVTIVDTPGTNAAVPEHQRRAEEVLSPDHRRMLQNRLERNAEETNQSAATADAVIHLTGAIAYADERDVLNAFHQNLGGHSNCLNAIGVLGKVDISPELIARRDEMANRIAGHLKEQLNTVVPVSAALHRVVSRICKLGRDVPGSLERLIEDLRSIPVEVLETLLIQDSIFFQEEPDGCPLNANSRNQLFKDLERSTGTTIDWGVFATIVREIVRDDAEPNVVASRLLDIAGFSRLRQTLDRYFFNRGRVLRCFRTVQAVRDRVLNRMRFELLDAADRQASEERKTLAKFLAFLQKAQGDRSIATELEQFVRMRLDPDLQRRQLDQMYIEIEKELCDLHYMLENHNQDFSAAQEVLANPNHFSPDEFEELQWIFGVKAWDFNERVSGLHTSPEHAAERQAYWRNQGDLFASRHSPKRRVAERAEKVYGHILGVFLKQAKR